MGEPWIEGIMLRMYGRALDSQTFNNLNGQCNNKEQSRVHPYWFFFGGGGHVLQVCVGGWGWGVQVHSTNSPGRSYLNL